MIAVDVSPEPGWPLAVGVVALTAVTVAASRWGRLGIGRQSVVAVVRAIAQLAIIAAIIGIVLPHWWASLLMAGAMFGFAAFTAARRIGAVRSVGWVALAMAPACGTVLVVIFATGAAPWTGASIISIAGIVIGNTMTATGQAGKVLFGALDQDFGQVEAALALGMSRPSAIHLVIDRRTELPLTPSIDSTATVGLVKLPGAFIGVLLGGGSAAQASASQLLVLAGILATQAMVVAVVARLIAHGRLLTAPLRARMPAG